MAFMRGILGVLAICAVAAVSCGTGSRLDTQGDGPGGGHLLPVINQVDSGVIPLVDGEFQGEGQDLVLTDPASQASLRLMDTSSVVTAEPGYDLDGDGDLDIVVLTMRGLSAQAAGTVDNDTISPTIFSKVGGVALLPMDTTFTVPVEMTIPVHPDFATAELSLYKYRNFFLERNAAQDIGTGSGLWESVPISVTNSGGFATFSLSLFGEYAVVAEHDQGSGGSV